MTDLAGARGTIVPLLALAPKRKSGEGVTFAARGGRGKDYCTFM